VFVSSGIALLDDKAKYGFLTDETPELVAAWVEYGCNSVRDRGKGAREPSGATGNKLDYFITLGL
jgi:hypothetical protein